VGWQAHKDVGKTTGHPQDMICKGRRMTGTPGSDNAFYVSIRQFVAVAGVVRPARGDPDRGPGRDRDAPSSGMRPS